MNEAYRKQSIDIESDNGLLTFCSRYLTTAICQPETRVDMGMDFITRVIKEPDKYSGFFPIVRKILLSLFPFLFLASASAVPQKSEKPNIVFILADDLGYGDLSCMGGKNIHTPNIDELFASGVSFTSFYSNSPVCSPTRAALLTGCYPDMAGVPGVIRTDENSSWGYLAPNITTLPQMLKNNGYQTALIGKWHLGLKSPNTPNERGFDYFHGFLGDMMDDYWTHRRHGINYMRLNTTEIDPLGHATDIFTEWAQEYILKKKDDEKPFFLFLAYNAPHFPIQPPEEWVLNVKKREGEIDEKRALNVAFVEHLDAGIGKIIQTLKETGQIENTIVVFTSDNGGHLDSGASNGNLRGGKQDMYEGGIKVPCSMVWKGKIKPNTSVNRLSVTMDFFPTFCEIAQVQVLHQIDGITLLPAINGNVDEHKDRTVYFMRREGGFYGGLCYYAVRKGDYKLVQNTPYEELQLFNIAADPYEQTILDRNNKLYKELKARLAQHIRASGAIPWQKPVFLVN